MGEQFQALKKPPTLTLSIAVESDLSRPHPDSADQDEGQKYRLTLDSSRKGATVTEQTSHVSRDTIDTTLSKLEQMLRQSHIDVADIDALDSLGKILGEDIIQDLHEYFEAEWCEVNAEGADQTLHLQLQLPRELMRYPWELMHDGKQLLCQRYAMGRQVFMDTGLARRAPRRKSRAIRALIIGDPEFGGAFHDLPQLPGARQEAKEVADLFGLLGQEWIRTKRADIRVTCSDCPPHSSIRA
jgi:CHAT domain-containing protein